MAVKVLVWSSGDQVNMVSSWCDELFCTILKDGTISLRPSKDGEDEYGGRWWFRSRRGVRTPKQFWDALYSIDEIELPNDHWMIEEDIVPQLFEHIPLFALALLKFTEVEQEGEESDLEFFFMAQGRLLNLDIKLPSDIPKAMKLYDVIFNYFKQHHTETGALPVGDKTLMDTRFSIPAKNFRQDRDLIAFWLDQRIKDHVASASWGVLDFDPTKQIENFCLEYFNNHKGLPVGKFHIGQTEVTFNDQT